MPRATTVRFTNEMFARLDQAASRTGLPVNSIVIAACLEWMRRYTPNPADLGPTGPFTLSPDVLVEGSALQQFPAAPRWATLRRAVEKAVGQRHYGTYPFESFSDHAKALLTLAQAEAKRMGFPYIGTEHLLLACFDNVEFQSAKVLAALGIERKAAGAAIEKALGQKRLPRRSQIIPTSRVKKVIEISFEEARRIGDERVDTGHLLMGLMIESDGIAARVLRDLGATLQAVRDEMEKLRPDF